MGNGAARAAPVSVGAPEMGRCPRDGMCQPRGGCSHVSKSRDFGIAAWMGNLKAEVWDGFLKEEELYSKVRLCPRGRVDVCNVG